MTDKKKDPANVVMLRGVRVNMFNDQLYVPEAELTTKGKKKGCFRFNWSSKFIFPKKDTPEGKALLAAAKAGLAAAKKEKWGDKADDMKIKASNTPLVDGDHEDAPDFSAYEGAYFLSASKTVYGKNGGTENDVPKRPFRIIGPRKVKNDAGELKFPDVKSGEEGAPYSGCTVNLKVEFWGQDADGERGIPNRLNATILAVQFAKHGEAFGGGSRPVNVDDDFEEEDDGDDDDFNGGGSSSKDEDDDELDI